MTEFAC